MKKEDKLVNKIKLLLRKLNCPRWLHHFGPKKYKLLEKVYCLFLKTEWRYSFRRTKKMCKQLGIKCPSKSVLQYTLMHLPCIFLKNMLTASVKRSTNVAAMDGTTFAQSNPSWHYINMAGIDIKQRKNIKLSTLVDTRTS